MEENTTNVTSLNSQAGKEKETKQTIDPAQLQAVLRQAEGRMQQMAEQLRQLDQMLRDKTVDQLFTVLKYSVHFDEEFVAKSAKCIENYLTKIAFTTEEQPNEEADKKED